MKTAQMGDKIAIQFALKLRDGQVIGSTAEGSDEVIELGSGRLFPAIEKALVGMSEGESKTVEIDSDDAFGAPVPELVMEVSRQQLPPEMEPAVGMQIEGSNPSGAKVIMTVVEVGDESITVDANHPLAGTDLTFDLKLVSIQD